MMVLEMDPAEAQVTGGLSSQHTGVLGSREGVGTGWGELLSAISLSASAQGPRERSGRLFPRLLTVVPLVVKFQMDFLLFFMFI